MFADFAHQIKGELHSCDISQKTLKMQGILQKAI